MKKPIDIVLASLDILNQACIPGSSPGYLSHYQADLIVNSLLLGPEETEALEALAVKTMYPKIQEFNAVIEAIRAGLVVELQLGV